MKNLRIKLEPGFTLVEMAIVLALIGLVLGTGLTLLSAQQDQRKMEDTNSLLNGEREALIGFAIAYGRLPCPASSSSNGMESFAAGGNASNGNCSNFYNGFLPSATLALSGTDSSGFALDSWGNRIRYAVTTSNNNAFTKNNGINTLGISSLTPDLQVCSTSNGVTGSPPSCASGPPSTSLASNGVPSVIYSLGFNGKPGGTGGTSGDEAENPNPKSADNDRLFISHSLSSANESGGEFDDQVIWLSQYVLYNRMVQAGKLP